MTRLAPLAWVCVGLLLAAIALGLVLASRSGGGGRGAGDLLGSALLGIGPGQVAGFEVVGPEGGVERVVRDDRLGFWVVEAEAPGDGGGVAGGGTWRRWPVPEQRVRAAARLVTQARILGVGRRSQARGQGSGMEEGLTGATPVRVLRADAGDPIEMLISPRTLGGHGVVEVLSGGRRGVFVATDDLNQLFGKGGLRHWRDGRLLPIASEPPTMIQIESGAGRVVLRRVGRSWAMESPVSARADADAVARLLVEIDGLRARAFVDAPESEFDGVVRGGPAALRITLESGAPGIGRAGRARLRSQVEVWEADRGDSGQGGGGAWVCRAGASIGTGTDGSGRAVLGPIWAMVDPADLTGFGIDPAGLVSRVAVRTPPADVTWARFWLSARGDEPTDDENPRAVVYRRTLDGWTRRSSGGEAESVGGPEARGLVGLIRLLSGQAAMEVVLSEQAVPGTVGVRGSGPGEEGGPMVSLRLGSIGDLPRERVEVGLIGSDSSAEPRRLIVGSGGVWRLYAPDQAPAAARLIEELTGQLGG